jgi:hypothetical protein
MAANRSGVALLDRQAGLCAVERLDLALFVDAEYHGVRRRIDIKLDDVAQLVDELWILGELELANAVRLQSVRAPTAADLARLQALVKDRNASQKHVWRAQMCC